MRACHAWRAPNCVSARMCLPTRPRRYVRLQQNGSGVVGIDSFASFGTTTYYNDINQLITSWDVFANIG